MKIPTLAIHLTDRSNKFEPNTETHTRPVLASYVIDQIFGSEIEPEDGDKYNIETKHFKTLLSRISTDLGIKKSQIVDFELNVIDTMPS